MVRNFKSFLAVVMGLALVLSIAGDADARGKKKRRRRGKKAKVTKKAPPKVETRAVAELMGGFEWGMSPKKVLSTLFDRIDEKYKEQIKSTTDVYEQDRLRKEANKEKRELKKSFIRFKGQRTGWDVSIIDDEFGHKNDESMLVFWERDAERGINQRRFFFFVDNQLYKMYIAFDAQMFPDGKRTFPYFHQIMEGRYGGGELVFEEDKYGDQRVKHVHWQDAKHYLRAINKLEFYGTFALALSDPRVDRWIADRRAERNPQAKRQNAIIDSVTEGDEDSTTLQETNSNVLDHILREN